MIKRAASILLVLQSSEAFTSPRITLPFFQPHPTFFFFPQQPTTILRSTSNGSSSSSSNNPNNNSDQTTSSSTLDGSTSDIVVSSSLMTESSNSLPMPSTASLLLMDPTTTTTTTDMENLMISGNHNLDPNVAATNASTHSSNDMDHPALLQTNTSADVALLPTNSSSGSLAEEIIAKEKRVHVTIKYSNIPGLRPYFLTIANKIKSSNPDVIIEKQILPTVEDDVLEETVFEVIVDGKVVVGKSSAKFQPVRRSNKDEVNKNRVYGMSVYVSMGDVNAAISKARKKRRPTTSYLPEDREKAIRLEMLRSNDDK